MLKIKKLDNKRGIALFIVLTITLVVAILASVIMSIMLNQQRRTHQEVSRIQAYYAAQAGMVYTLEQLRLGIWASNAVGGVDKYACMRGCLNGVTTPDYTIPVDADIKYNVTVTIHPLNSGISNTARIDVITDYTYTP